MGGHAILSQCNPRAQEESGCHIKVLTHTEFAITDTVLFPRQGLLEAQQKADKVRPCPLLRNHQTSTPPGVGADSGTMTASN